MASEKFLNEHETKQLLAAYGVPVVDEIVARNIKEAFTAAVEIGFPVVLKGLGSSIIHKTERSLVHLNITRKADLKRAAEAIVNEAKDELEGILVQPYYSGRREFVAGFSRDAMFGPVVMFGIGGFFTEALTDITMRIVPLTRNDAMNMMDEIQAKLLLGPFRGEKAPDREALIRTLTGLSLLALEHPEISEIDVNPLIVSPMGEVRAVDALAVLSGTVSSRTFSEPVDPMTIRPLFYPRSIAFIGASPKVGKWGHRLPTHTITGEFFGDIYLVNPGGGIIAGRPVYKEIGDVPGEVDLAVITIPARHVISLLPRLKAKGIKNALLISSGFSETGAEGARLQQELVERARQEDILILGPNTMGIANPYISLYCTGYPVQPKPGGTAVISQSGNMGVQLLGFAEEQGIGIRCFCGSGNEAMVTVEDFIDGFGVDDATKVVILYIEGLHDGHRFFESARKVSRKKPIILLKGGQSEVGEKAALSHTGAMTSDVKVFDAACSQAGIIKVEQSVDLLDLAAAFSSLPLPRGNRVAIMTFGGGWGVITADLCARYGLTVPTLTPELINSFDRMLPCYWSKSNPVDMVGEIESNIVINILEELMRWDGCDSVVDLGVKGRADYFGRVTNAAKRLDPDYSEDYFDRIGASMQSFELEHLNHIVRLMDAYKKPIYGVSLLTTDASKIVHSTNSSKYNPVFYQTPERAVRANAGMYEYSRSLQGDK